MMKKTIIMLVAVLSVTICKCIAKPVNPTVYKDIASNQFRPSGWVEEFLNRQESGLTGHPEESGFPYNSDGWINGLDYTEREIKGGASWFPYEQVAYYMDGALRCGYLINNAAMKRIAKENIDYMIVNADEDGRMRLRDIKDDWWPLVVFIRLMTEEYEISKDSKLLDALIRHYKATYADDSKINYKFGGFSSRSLLHVEHLCKLYEYTEDRWFLDVAEKLYKKFENGTEKPMSTTAKGMNEKISPSGHAVTYHEFLKLPAVLYYYTGKDYYRTAFENGIAMLERDHELADGLSSAVEGTKGNSSIQAHELCNTIDYNWSVGWAMLATANSYYADKIEKCIYNSGMSAITPDFKAHQYYSAPNLPISNNMSSNHNDNTNWGMFGKKRLCYRPGHDTECCSGNMHRMLPTFINRSSMISNGEVKINFYIPGTTTFDYKGDIFEYTQETNYPFEFCSKITINHAPDKKINFGLRIPVWATAYNITLNGNPIFKENSDKACYKEIFRKFNNGDIIEITFDTKPRFESTSKGIAVNYGPLVYSYPIESYKNIITSDDAGKCSEEFPAYEYFPKYPQNWAYALIVNEGIEVINLPQDTYFWEIGASPIKLRVKAKAVKNWKLKEWSYITEYPSKLELEDKITTLTLEPIGSTILRITDFPKVEQ